MRDLPWRSGHACPVCGGLVEAAATLPPPRFRHADFAAFADGPIEILACPNCGAAGVVQTNADLRALFDTQDYVLRPVPVHEIHLPRTGKRMPAPAYQASLLASGVPPQASILDVGCFDGRLLKAFAKLRPDVSLMGFDVSEQFAALVHEGGGGIEYVTGRLRNHRFENRFDLVTLSHSLQYEADLVGLLATLRMALKSDGRLFIQAPDVERKPSNLLLADLHHHFTRTSLHNLLARCGFSPELVAADGFPRDILMIGKPATGTANMRPGSIEPVKRAAGHLAAQAERIKSLAGEGNWHVLGTTIDAAFAAAALGERLAGFVDENCEGAGRFHQRTVRHPRQLRDGDRTLLLLGSGSTETFARFQHSYRGQFVLV